jgi:hypothetical protein
VEKARQYTAVIHVVDWWALGIGAFLVWAALSAAWRQFRTGVARDGEYLGAKRYAHRTHPVAYWLLMLVNGMAIAFGAWLVAVGLGAIK